MALGKCWDLILNVRVAVVLKSTSAMTCVVSTPFWPQTSAQTELCNSTQGQRSGFTMHCRPPCNLLSASNKNTQHSSGCIHFCSAGLDPTPHSKLNSGCGLTEGSFSPTPCRDIFHQPRLLRVLSNLAWNNSMDVAPTISLGTLSQDLLTLIKHFVRNSDTDQISKQRTNSLFLQDEQQVWNVWQNKVIGLQGAEVMDTHTQLSRQFPSLSCTK